MKKWTFVAPLLVVVLALTFAPVMAQDGGELNIWSRFATDDPQVASDRWMVGLMEDFAEGTGNTSTNTFYPFDQINATLNVAVQSGVNVPDVSYVDTQQLGFFNVNGTLTDITDFVTSADWFDDLDPVALQTCTTPDGVILCVPVTSANFYMYYWTDAWPDGFPETTTEFLEEAPAVLEAGYFPVTFKGAEGASVERVYANLMRSYGATLAGPDGEATWASPESVEAIQFVRDIFDAGFVPEVALAPQFEFEEPFKQGQAGGFIAGTFSYVYLTPLIAPSGEVFEEEITGEFDSNAISVGDAFDAGEIAYAPPWRAPDGMPFSQINAEAWAIPFGSENPELALEYLDFLMQTDQNVAVAIANGQLPTLMSAQEDPAFETVYWQTAIEYRTEFGAAPPAWLDYDSALRLLSTAVVNIITDPNVDIMEELMDAQEEYNLGLEAL